MLFIGYSFFLLKLLQTTYPSHVNLVLINNILYCLICYYIYTQIQTEIFSFGSVSSRIAKHGNCYRYQKLFDEGCSQSYHIFGRVKPDPFNFMKKTST